MVKKIKELLLVTLPIKRRGHFQVFHTQDIRKRIGQHLRG